MSENNENSFVKSTPINTIRSLKIKQSYSKLPSGSDGYPGSLENTSIPPETPPEANGRNNCT